MAGFVPSWLGLLHRCRSSEVRTDRHAVITTKQASAWIASFETQSYSHDIGLVITPSKDFTRSIKYN
jgi:hypothetical protein